MPIFFIFYFVLFIIPVSRAHNYSSAEILQRLQRLNVLGSALYIAAHPDDENTAVLAYLAKQRHIRTGYLSLTRGSGGQNLLGPEKGDLLGVLRTRELLAARKIDGAEQFFTRAIDFGYSKSADETLRQWDRETILNDMVHVIREFQPDVIITRFSETRGGHGHHLASAILAREAFRAAADGMRFEHQLQHLDTWQARRLVWDSWEPSGNAVSIDIGLYNSALGSTTQQLAAASRSMHKSQGFGSSPGHGPRIVSFEHLAGDTAVTDLFDAVNLSWNRVPFGSLIQPLVDQLIREYKPAAPWESVPLLIDIYRLLKESPQIYWIVQKRKEVKELVRLCSGLWLEATTGTEGLDKGERLTVKTLAVNRSHLDIYFKRLAIDPAGADSLIVTRLEANVPVSISRSFRIPETIPYSQPYWLRLQPEKAMYHIREDHYTGLAEAPPVLKAVFTLDIHGESFEFTVPVEFSGTDPVLGEIRKPFTVRPALSINPDKPVSIFPDGEERDLHITLESLADSLEGRIIPRIDGNWDVSPSERNFSITQKGRKTSLSFELSPPDTASVNTLRFEVHMDGPVYSNQIVSVEYPHIRPQTVLLPAEIRLSRVDLEIIPRKIGYIMGSGDEIPAALEQLGYNVTLLNDEQLESGNLSQFDVIICGIRAFNTREVLLKVQNRLTAFAENGGTWIVQHNTRFGNRIGQIGPYRFSTAARHRIAEEDAPIEILQPGHPLMNYPNKISPADFEGWVQERGLYFADEWEEELIPLFSGHDEGEPARPGGLLYAPYGKGIFIYTAYSWFRQLPAGVPGAYRIFVNLISAGVDTS